MTLDFWRLFWGPPNSNWSSASGLAWYTTLAVVQVNGKCSGAFAIEQSFWQGCSLSPLLYVLSLEPLLHRLTDGGASPVLRGIPIAKVSANANDITVFVSHRLDIKAVKKAVARYDQIAGAKINFDKSEGLRLSAWRVGVPLPETFLWSDGPVRILEVWFGPDLQVERNWSEVQAKVDAQLCTWLRRRLSLKTGWRCAPCASSSWSFTVCISSAKESSAGATTIPLQITLRRPMVRRQVFWQRSRYKGLGMPDLEKTGFLKNWLTLADPFQRTQCRSERWVRCFLALNQIPKLGDEA